MVRFVHSADWQLGMTRHFLSGEAQSRFGQDRIDAIRRLGALAHEHGAGFLVVGGDVFETNQVERQTVLRALEAMGSVGLPIFLLPGNHDPLDAASVYTAPTFREHRPDNVIVLDDESPRPVPGVPGAEVGGAPWRSKRPLEDLVARAAGGLGPPPAGIMRVLVGHGATDTLSPNPDDPALVRVAAAERALADGRVHYVALGDRHSTTRVSDTGAIWYSGAPEATDFREERSGRALLVGLEPGRPPEVRELEVGRWRFMDEERVLEEREDVEALERFLREQPEKERTVVRLALRGALPLAERARVDALLEQLGEVFASLQLWERNTDLRVRVEVADAESLGLSGYGRAAWERLSARATAGGPGDEQAATAADALALLQRLAGEARP